jgi:hypothetical protein
MAYLVRIDGGDPFPIDDESAATDDALKATLAPFYPLVANAKIVRPAKVKEGEPTIITITKQAGPKGAGRVGEAVAASLRRARERVNPAVALDAAPEEIVAATPPAEVERVVALGVRDTRTTRRAVDVLRRAAPAASVDVPVGF